MENLLESARELDRQDDLREFRDAFWIPQQSAGGDQAYFCGHSLGLQPRTAESALETEMGRWRKLAVSGHFRGEPCWIDYGDDLAAMLAGLVGAEPGEVTVMNTLTVNLHLLMVSFYRPAGHRRKILIERGAFPSDRYAVESQIRFHGLDPAQCLVELEPGSGGRLHEEADIEAWLKAHGEEVALVLWPGVQYASGQAFDLRRIAVAGHAAGARVGFDLAHAAGNLPLQLHDSGCDFAAWCTYKYLNGGPGAVAASFVHARHAGDTSLPRFEGWWGNERSGRFRMDPHFTPAAGAEAWQLSNPPILAMAPLRASLALFREAGMERLRAKSLGMTQWLAGAIESRLGDVLEVLTPADPGRRGCQLSLRVRAGHERGRELYRWLGEHGVVSDWREPDILRVAPVPLYNRFEDCHEFLRQVGDWAAQAK
ncbi:MAG: kynureninase [Xanthomonadales bacterium]|jgi:kynureninase|nr:kynureninase [Xanthomonadales bacterium]